MRNFIIILLKILLTNILVKCYVSNSSTRIKAEEGIEDIYSSLDDEENGLSDLTKVIANNIEKVFDFDDIKTEQFELEELDSSMHEPKVKMKSRAIDSITGLNKSMIIILPNSTVSDAIIKSNNNINLKDKSPYLLFNITGPHAEIVEMSTEEIAVKDKVKLSCFFCSNVQDLNCNEPTFKTVPTVVCDSTDDVCYSRHTPFGIVERGCFNPALNTTLFVCSCNLCNCLSISKLPYSFQTKKEWLKNIVAMTHLRHLKQSVLKNTECLRCETNNSSKAKTGSKMLDDINCLEGIVPSLQTKICGDNYVCAVKARVREGYLWRGCIRRPKYNYWWNLCSKNYCNSDRTVYFYDEIKHYEPFV